MTNFDAAVVADAALHVDLSQKASRQMTSQTPTSPKRWPYGLPLPGERKRPRKCLAFGLLSGMRRMHMLVDGIKARFNGQDLAMKIHREDLPWFEFRHGAAYLLYKRIAAGEWTSSDIEPVASVPSKRCARAWLGMTAAGRWLCRKSACRRCPSLSRCGPPTRTALSS